MDEVAPGKQLTTSFLLKLTSDQLQLLFDTLILADGHRDEKTGRMAFIQNWNETLGSFQVLCLLLGKTSSASRKPDSRRCFGVSVNDKVYRQVKRMRIERIPYKGIVWCPTIKDNHTWVARRNGKIDVTGNSYGMGTVMLKTLGYNPAFYNKVQYLLKEASGGKDPQEKAALESKYYSYLDKPGYLRIPWFDKSPAYVRMTNMLPFYSLSLLNPAERNYESRFGDALTGLIDRSPFFKTPTGNTMLNYVILPMLLGEAINQFGQPIYPRDAGLLEKAAIATSGAIEPYNPLGRSAGTALGALPVGVPEAALPYVPSQSYKRMRNALKGRTPLGIPAKEPAGYRALRAALSDVGVPITPVNTNISSPKKKK